MNKRCWLSWHTDFLFEGQVQPVDWPLLSALHNHWSIQ
jgi:hypothetical protein